MKEKKNIIPIIALIVLAIAIVGIIFQPNFIQFGDNVISDTYYNTAYDAYKNSGDEFNIKEEITTININNKFALWFAVSTDDELTIVKMTMKNGKYFSLSDVSFYTNNTLNHNAPSLNDELTLGDKTLKYVILPESKYKQSDLEKEKYNTEYFEYNNTDYVFVYNLASD